MTGGCFVTECERREEVVGIARHWPHVLRGIGPVAAREIIPLGPPR